MRQTLDKLAHVGLGATLFTVLCRKYPAATRDQVLTACTTAIHGARLLDLDKTDPVILVTAERELRLVLGLDKDDARLDPERHAGSTRLRSQEKGNNSGTT